MGNTTCWNSGGSSLVPSQSMYPFPIDLRYQQSVPHHLALIVIKYQLALPCGLTVLILFLLLDCWLLKGRVCIAETLQYPKQC